jgi:LysM repeat protein
MCLRLWCVALALAFGLSLAGCMPINEPPQDETANPYYRTAKARLQARDYSGAIDAFEKAIQLDPNAVMAHFELALLYEQQMADYASAIYHYNKVLKLRPNGYPADNARVRVRVCRQELAKSEAMSSLVPSLPLQFEKLREENQRLHSLIASQRVELTNLRAQLVAARAAAGATPSPPSKPGVGGEAVASGSAPKSPTAASPSPSSSAATQPARLHTVQPGETLAAIARQYGVSLQAVQAANPRVNPRRLKVGQRIVVPSS